MKRLAKIVVAAMVLFFSITLLPVANVSAAKLKVNKVYTASNKVEGKTKKKYKIKVKIGKEKYKGKANKKGTFAVAIPQQKAGKKITVKAYKKKGGKWKLYAKKKIKVKKATTEILTNMALEDVKAGREHMPASEADVKAGKDYLYNGFNLMIGDVDKYIQEDIPELDAYGLRKYSGIKAKNGATLYVNAFYGGRVKEWYEGDLNDLEEEVYIGKTREELEAWYEKNKQYNFSGMNQLAEPTAEQCDYIINSGKEVKFYARNYPYIGNGVTGRIYYKAYAYVGDNLVAIRYYMIPLTGVKGTNYELSGRY